MIPSQKHDVTSPKPSCRTRGTSSTLFPPTFLLPAFRIACAPRFAEPCCCGGRRCFCGRSKRCFCGCFCRCFCRRHGTMTRTARFSCDITCAFLALKRSTSHVGSEDVEGAVV